MFYCFFYTLNFRKCSLILYCAASMVFIDITEYKSGLPYIKFIGEVSTEWTSQSMVLISVKIKGKNSYGLITHGFYFIYFCSSHLRVIEFYLSIITQEGVPVIIVTTMMRSGTRCVRAPSSHSITEINRLFYCMIVKI